MTKVCLEYVGKKCMHSVSVAEDDPRDRVRYKQMLCCRKTEGEQSKKREEEEQDSFSQDT